MRNILSLRGFGVRFGRKLVLSDVSFDIAETGVTHLMGPCGSGKSTLLRALAGLYRQSSSFQPHGKAVYLGESLGTREYPALLEQKPAGLLSSVFDTIVCRLPERASLDQAQQHALVHRLLVLYGAEQLEPLLERPLSELALGDRRVAQILGLAATAPALMLLDEPTAELDEAAALKLLDLVSRIARNRAVMLIQHNQKLAVHLGGRALLLAGGVVQEVASTVDLLARPRSVAGQEFSKSGTCAVPSPDTDPAYLDEAFVDRYKPAVAKVAPVPEIIPFGPRGFRWVDRNRLAATPRPGLMGDQELDLKALAKVGVDRLVSLEESETVPRMPAWRLGIKIRHLPIPDMQTPTFEEARRLVEEIDGWLAEGKRVAVHCKAGLGRTGTMLASYYVFKGLSPTEAIRKLRCVDPRMVQSEIQERFVEDFHQRLVDAGVKAESF